MERLSEFEKQLGYKFKRNELIMEAFCHRSFANEQPGNKLKDNERFEFLGDAVLNLIISHILMDMRPDLKEGDLSKTRAGLVNESTLSGLSLEIGIDKNIRLSKGEINTNGRHKKSILADTLEAVIAAIYLDRGFESAFETVKRLFAKRLEMNVKDAEIPQDYKSKIQEIAQSGNHIAPVYKVIDEKGPDHDKTFAVEIEVRDIKAEGIGKSKKSAEQNAAKAALEIIDSRQ